MNLLKVICRNQFLAALAAGIATIFVGHTTIFAQSVKIGRTVGGSGFHIPSYVGVDKGLFKAEGLDASFIAATAGVLVRATIAKEIEFTPIPGGGSEAMLKGAPLVFFVGQSLISQWTLTTTPDIKRVEDLRGKTLGLGRPGSADYSEIVITLGKHFKMQPGKDYRVISFTGEPDRIAALIQPRGDISHSSRFHQRKTRRRQALYPRDYQSRGLHQDQQERDHGGDREIF
jgi:hypothetical protein